MDATGCKSLFSAEPVQWAVDYLQGLMEILEENTVRSSYGVALLALEREELYQVWHRMLEGYNNDSVSVFYAAGLQGARLFVVRQLLAALPSLKHCPLHNSAAVYHAAGRRLADEHTFLKSFRLPLEEKPPSAGVLERSLEILASKGMLDRLHLAGRRLHIYCLDYRLPHEAYYLLPSHTIICGAGTLDEQEQLCCLLHEFGHIFYAASACRRQQSHSPTLRQQAAERFAQRFAARLLSSAT
ncbi:MAG: hypothetical protein KGZ79_05310 [Dethiobacter sp.]|jgi:hypothetical protein|nr:hypothetical protein [Dethiobacter sp.]